MPGQTATLKYTILSRVEISAGHYSYKLPDAFYPDYKKHGLAKKDFEYEFAYTIRFKSAHRITNLCVPDGAEVVEKSEDASNILVRGSEICR